jgi:NTP pyrophosphatase (non-canonical NTP hydrolase)
MSKAPEPVPGTDDPYTLAVRNVLRGMALLVVQVNRDNGWFDESRTVGDGIALLHSEVSEAFEAWRETGFADATKEVRCPDCGGTQCKGLPLPKPEGFGSEMADILIRLLDECTRHNVDLAGEFTRKLAYNKTRGFKHGGKAI